MKSIDTKNLSFPDQTTTPFEKGKIETVTVAGVTLLRETLQPGWKLSEHVKPVFKTNNFHKPHLKYIIS